MTMTRGIDVPLVLYNRDGADSIVPLRFRALVWLAGLALAALLLACAS